MEETVMEGVTSAFLVKNLENVLSIRTSPKTSYNLESHLCTK